MAEGGMLAWKRQEVSYRGPVADYSNLRVPLPPPTKGMKWVKNSVTREWKLEKIDNDILIESLDEECSRNGTGIDENDNEVDGGFEENKQRVTARDDREKRKTDPRCAAHKKKKTQLKQESFVEHYILPTDTFQGLCLKYKVSPSRLRQANRMVLGGANLRMAGPMLVVPVDSTLIEIGKIKLQDRNSIEFKIQVFLAEFPDLRSTEARFYIDMAEGDLDKAIEEARNDVKWEKSIVKAANEAEKQKQDEGVVTYTVDTGIPVDPIQKPNCYKQVHNYKSVIEVEMASLL